MAIHLLITVPVQRGCDWPPRCHEFHDLFRNSQGLSFINCFLGVSKHEREWNVMKDNLTNITQHGQLELQPAQRSWRIPGPRPKPLRRVVSAILIIILWLKLEIQSWCSDPVQIEMQGL